MKVFLLAPRHRHGSAPVRAAGRPVPAVRPAPSERQGGRAGERGGGCAGLTSALRGLRRRELPVLRLAGRVQQRTHLRDLGHQPEPRVHLLRPPSTYT